MILHQSYTTMSPTSFRLEIDHHTLKLIVGVMAISLALLTAIFSDTPLDSISDAYYEVGKSRDILVGFLFAIAAFLLAYNGRSKRELVLSKIAASFRDRRGAVSLRCGVTQRSCPDYTSSRRLPCS